MGEEDSSSDSSAGAETPKMKPVFVPRAARARLEASLAAETRAREQQADAASALEAERAAQTHARLRATLEQEREEEALRRRLIARGKLSLVEAPPAPSDAPALPNDEIAETLARREFELWQARELARLKRDWLRAHKEELAAEAKESRQRLSAPALVAENEALRAARLEQAGVRKGKMAFMQKYYHKGAFFQNVVETGAEKAFKKDFNAAVPEEQVDLTLLPKAMQLRRGDFGKRSRSKYTHLRDQDTTDLTAGWHQRADRADQILHRKSS